MRGVVNNFLESKRYGFIDGEDNKDYFFHISEVIDRSKKITAGLPVRFTEALSPKGYKAKHVELLGDDMKYEVPDRVFTSKAGEIRGWTIIRQGKYSLKFESDSSIDEARKGLNELAHSLGITGIINLLYKRKTGGKWYNNYKYSIHCFEGLPVSLARKSPGGEYPTIESTPDFGNALENHIINGKKYFKIDIETIIIAFFVVIFLILFIPGI